MDMEQEALKYFAIIEQSKARLKEDISTEDKRAIRAEADKAASDFAIKYFNQRQDDDVITLFENSKNLSKSQTFKLMDKQKENLMKEVESALDEIINLTDEVRDKGNEYKDRTNKKENHTSADPDKEKQEGDGEIETAPTQEGENQDKEAEKDSQDEKKQQEKNKKKERVPGAPTEDVNSSSESGDEKENSLAEDERKAKELEEKAKELEEKAKEMKEAMESLSGVKASELNSAAASGIIMEERARFEAAQDKMNLEVAYNIVEKNRLTALREAMVLQIQIGLQKGEDISDETNQLVTIEGKINQLDIGFAKRFGQLQTEVSNAHSNLQNATKEAIKKVEADFRNSYKHTMIYSSEAILKGEKIDLTKDFKRVVYDVQYTGDVLASGKPASIASETININGQVVRVVNQEDSRGVENSFLNGNDEQFRAGAGNVHYVTKDANGSLIADQPELEEAMDQIGIHGVDDIEEACERIDERAEENAQEEEMEEEYYPGQNPTYEDDET